MGREIALELGRCGAVVVCVDIREDTNQETMRLVQQQRQENIKILGISKNNSEMFSIKFTGPVIISVIILLKFLACASLKNYGKTHGNFPRIP